MTLKEMQEKFRKLQQSFAALKGEELDKALAEAEELATEIERASRLEKIQARAAAAAGGAAPVPAPVLAAGATVEQKQERLNALRTSFAALTGEALDAALAEADALTADLDRTERVERHRTLAAATGRRASAPPSVFRPAPGAKGILALDDPRFDAIVAALPRGERAIMAASGDLFQESQSADGGVLLPIDKRELVRLLNPDTMVQGRCDTLYTTSNAITVPVDNDPVWSDDMAAGDVGEGDELTEDKAGLGSVTLTLTKSGALTRVTREMIEDVAGIGQYITGKLGDKLAWKGHRKAIAAFLAAASKLTVAKASGAAAGSAPTLANINKMYASMLVQHRPGAVWLANPALEGVFEEFFVAGTTGGIFPVYLPPGGIADAPYARLKGLPVLYVEGMPAVGTEGDLVLVNPSTFWGVLKTQGPRIDQSIEAEFKKDVVLYRGYVRSVYGSKFGAQITRADGTKAGNVITVGTRA